MKEFIVQYYDPPTREWKKFGQTEEYSYVAEEKAYDLYKNNLKKATDVRVREENTLSIWKKNT